MKKRNFSSVLKNISTIVVIAACLSACGSSSGNTAATKETNAIESKTDTGSKSRTYQIGFTTAMNEGDPYYEFALAFKNQVEERTNGSISIDLMGNSQLGAEGEMFTGMQQGLTDMAIMTNAYCSGYVPASGVFDLPFLFETTAQAAEVLDSEVGQKVLLEYETQNVKALAWGEGGYRQLVTKNTKVTKPEDMKGLKIRCMETESYIATYQALGVNPVPMAWSECMTGMQQGTIDGLDIPVSFIYNTRFQDVAKYTNMISHFYSPLVLCVSKDIYDSLSSEEQEILTEAAVAAGAYTREIYSQSEADYIDKLEEDGMVVNVDVDFNAFREAMGDLYNERKATVGGTYVDDVLKMVGYEE